MINSAPDPAGTNTRAWGSEAEKFPVNPAPATKRRELSNPEAE